MLQGLLSGTPTASQILYNISLSKHIKLSIQSLKKEQKQPLFITVQKMQVKNKEDILKLLNFDSMINDYLKEPKLHKKTPATNHLTHKTKPYKLDHSKLASTLDIDNNDSTNGKRNLSMRNFTKCNTIETKKVGDRQYQSISGKVESGRVRDCGDSRVPHSKKCVSSKLFKTEKTFQTLQGSQVEFVKHQGIKKRKVQNQSTNIIDSQNQIQQLNMTPAQSQKPSKSRLASQFLFQSPKPGTLLKSRYQLQKPIGRGLSGQVYKAQDILSHRPVALKLLDLSNIEYEFIKQLQHPNMIAYYNNFVEGGRRCLVLEYLPWSLAEVLRKRRLDEGEVRRVFRGIVAGLVYLHALSYAHRDIKPDNIVVNEDLTVVKFIDFGLCVDTTGNDYKQMKRFCGTTSYMAPQVISGRCRQPKKADIWSLGVVLYVLSVGRNPFTGRQEDQIFNKIKNNKTIFPPEMSEKLRSLLTLMLNKNPQERPSVLQVMNHTWLAQ